MKPEALKELINDLERGDYVAIGANLAGAAVNLLVAVFWGWPSPWSAISFICVGWGLAAAVSQLWYVALRVTQRKFFEDVTADLAQHRATLTDLHTAVHITPEFIERGRATSEAAMQGLIDCVLDGLKRNGDLDPGIQVQVRLDVDGRMSMDNSTTRH